MKNRSVAQNEFEAELVRLKEKFSLLERRLSLKADEVVHTMAVSHRREIDGLKDEVFRLREELKKVRKEQKRNFTGGIVKRQRRVV
ncbi:hypothetical protein [Halobacillus salinus]|uniref:hypothetical protein n=1 Tax=Halobacillus salinus TaxID=192814 RepID=UPI0009A6A0DF|nr:hypothetical protein [Halobacillus salinus]